MENRRICFVTFLRVIFKTMPLWFQKGIISKDREKNNPEGNSPTIPTYIIRAGFILISLNDGADVYHTSA
jgi:hypothetical protein